MDKNQEKIDLNDWIRRLKKASEKNIIIVEGIKDKKALESYGVSNIFTLKKPLYAVIEDIVSNKKTCIILTDLDKKGKHIYSELSSKLHQFGVNIDDSFREFLFTTKLRQIEGLTRYLKRLDVDLK